MNKQVKFPQHFISQMAVDGNLKLISLLGTLKVAYPDGFVPAFRKVNLKALGYSISKKTYYTYLKRLERLKFVKSNGKGGMFLIGQKQILWLYPHIKPKYIYLDNNKELRSNFEFIALCKNIESQQFKQKLFSKANALCKTETVIKKANGEYKVCKTPLELETSISCRKQAAIIGYRSPMTGLKRRRKLVEKGFIQSNTRRIDLGILTKGIEENYRINLGWTLKFICGTWYRILANEILVLKTIGVKLNTQCL